MCACASIVLAALAHHLDGGRRGVVFAYDMDHSAKATFELLTRAIDAIHDIAVVFIGEDDRIVSRLGAKGVGEIGLVGVAAAVDNAIYHATGKRIRSTPMTPDKVMR